MFFGVSLSTAVWAAIGVFAVIVAMLAVVRTERRVGRAGFGVAGFVEQLAEGDVGGPITLSRTG